ncbi:MAG TPA: hypothetical protein VFX40_03430 [Gemmatimonadaceae bacterium]|nr:hypothetical protein [Gemmatimonadaceae bacterium]
MRARLAWLAFLVSTTPAVARAQETHSHADTSSKSLDVRLGASGILVGTVASPGVSGRTLAEAYLTQPMIMAMVTSPGRRIAGLATINFEGLTLRRGELNAGVYGEGYVDRRHPHTWLHELVATGTATAGSARFSITAGKGFVPFGTDDPMSRPFVKYPVNHHLAQILERAGFIAALRVGSIGVEGALFNGDEPDSPSDFPDFDRIGDSWALRGTVYARTSIEVQASFAQVESPELAFGGGLDHRKWSTSGRFQDSHRYALVEWARTSERDRGDEAFAFASILAEGSAAVGSLIVSVRAERTERPEEERTGNAFRTPRPHSDLGIAGRTRWDMLNAAASTNLKWRAGKFSPFIEVSTQRPTLFEPRDFYGASRLWSFSAGIRAGAGARHSRMGRYGVAAAELNH